MLRILFLGENWSGSNARSCSDALQRIGHNVLLIDSLTFLPRLQRFSSKAALRLLRPRLVQEYNAYILRLSRQFRPDMVFAFKGNFLYRETLSKIRVAGAALYNYYPDTSAYAHGPWIPKSLPEYDCVFYTKRFWYTDVSKAEKLRAAHYLPHGFDPILHRIVELDPRDIADYRCDVSFIATHTHYKETLLKGLIELRPSLDLSIWGEGWAERCRTPMLKRCIKGLPLLGDSYMRAIQAASINLAIMSGPVKGASSGDLTTSRTFIIPACGGFMLHERNEEVHELYEEGEEIDCFATVSELAHKIDYYLSHEEERRKIAKAGYRRCVPSYSYDRRVEEILRWHFDHWQSTQEHAGTNQVSTGKSHAVEVMSAHKDLGASE